MPLISQHRVGGAQGTQCLSDHGGTVRGPTTQIRPRAVHDVQCVVNGSSHDGALCARA